MVSPLFGAETSPIPTGKIDTAIAEINTEIQLRVTGIAAISQTVAAGQVVDANQQVEIDAKLDAALLGSQSLPTAPITQSDSTPASKAWVLNAIANAINSIPTPNPDPANAPQWTTDAVIRVRGGSTATIGAVLEILTPPVVALGARAPTSITVAWRGDGVAPGGGSQQSTVTMTIASPCVVTTATDFADAKELKLITTGALATGLTAGTTYFWKRTNATTGQLALTAGGASINTSGTQSGVHLAYAATVTVVSSDVGKGFDLDPVAIKATYSSVHATSNVIPIVSVTQPTNTSPPTFVQSPAQTWTVNAGAWTPAGVTFLLEIVINGQVAVSSTTGSTLAHNTTNAQAGQQIFGRVTGFLGAVSSSPISTAAQTITAVGDTVPVTDGSIALPTASPIPDDPVISSVTDLGNGSWRVVRNSDFSPDNRSHWFYKAAAADPPISSNYLGTTASGITTVVITPPSGFVFVEVGAENSTGYSVNRSTPVQLSVPPAPPPSSGTALADSDTRIRVFVNSTKSGPQLEAAYRFMSAQMPQSISVGAVQNPTTYIIGGIPQSIYRRGAAGSSDEGYIVHNLINGMPVWDGGGGDQRMRSAIHSSGPIYNTSDPNYLATRATQIERNKRYWFATGGTFAADMFSQNQPSNDNNGTQVGDWHHDSPSSAVSGQSPLAFLCNGLGYRALLSWTKGGAGFEADNNITSPDGGGLGVNGGEALTIIPLTMPSNFSVPHFLAFNWLSKSLNSGPAYFMQAFRQIGLDGPIETFGPWVVPTTYAGPGGDALYPKIGLHHWHPTLQGGNTRSHRSAGWLLVEDLVGTPTLNAANIFATLTKYIPRVGASPTPPPPPPPPPPSGDATFLQRGTWLHTGAAIDDSAVPLDTSANGSTPLTNNLSTGSDVLLEVIHFNSLADRINGITIGTRAGTRVNTTLNTEQSVIEHWHFFNIVGGNKDVTFDFSSGAANNFVDIALHEMQGLKSSPYHAASSNSALGTSTVAAVTSGVPAQAKTVMIGTMTHIAFASPTLSTPASPWTDAYENEDGTTEVPVSGARQYVTTAAAKTFSVTLGTSSPWVALISVFEVA